MSLFGMVAAMFGPVQSFASEDNWITRRIGASTHAGPVVNEFTAFELSPVYAAIGIIADGISMLPVDVGEKRGEKRKILEGHPLDQVLNRRANPYMSAFTFRSTLQSHCLGWGNGYAEIERNRGGEPIGLWPLLPDRTYRTKKGERDIFVTNIGGKSVSIPADNVLHIPALGFDGLTGYSPLYMHRQAIGLGKALEEHGGKFFANEARSGGFLEYPGKLSDVARKNLSDSVNEQGGLEHAQRVKILEEGAKFIQTTIAPDDAQFLGTRQFQVEEIARIYRVPLFMLQSHSKDTAWGTGLGQMVLGFVQFTLGPWIVRGEQEFEHKLLTPADEKRGMYLKHNVNALLRGDSDSRAKYYTAALSPQTGWMERDEVRAREDLNPLGEKEDAAPAPPELTGEAPAQPAPPAPPAPMQNGAIT